MKTRFVWLAAVLLMGGTVALADFPIDYSTSTSAIINRITVAGVASSAKFQVPMVGTATNPGSSRPNGVLYTGYNCNGENQAEPRISMTTETFYSPTAGNEYVELYWSYMLGNGTGEIRPFYAQINRGTSLCDTGIRGNSLSLLDQNNNQYMKFMANQMICNGGTVLWSASNNVNWLQQAKTTGANAMLIKCDSLDRILLAPGGDPTAVAGSFTTLKSVASTAFRSTVDQTLGAYSVLYSDATSGTRIAIVPLASGCLDRVYTVSKKDSGGNGVWITASGSDTIAGLSSIALTVQGQSRTIQSDGVSAWCVIASHPGGP